MFPDPPGVFCARSRPPTGHIVKNQKIHKLGRIQEIWKIPSIFPPICPLKASIGIHLTFEILPHSK